MDQTGSVQYRDILIIYIHFIFGLYSPHAWFCLPYIWFIFISCLVLFALYLVCIHRMLGFVCLIFGLYSPHAWFCLPYIWFVFTACLVLFALYLVYIHRMLGFVCLIFGLYSSHAWFCLPYIWFVFTACLVLFALYLVYIHAICVTGWRCGRDIMDEVPSNTRISRLIVILVKYIKYLVYSGLLFYNYIKYKVLMYLKCQNYLVHFTIWIWSQGYWMVCYCMLWLPLRYV